ncbi:hypothetical protein HRI_000083500 [Hibiscus trionum]|uniref:RNase H type-1 domain-containing protein n=1 Tax=Hibiscus trionum TaxID=183268 RepID=A0A9W7LH48_HIBTR|nr:hypothetical protein HRI_000083500 [Hibiscus trionum]
MWALIWIKAVNESLILEDVNLWKNPVSCLELKSKEGNIEWIPSNYGSIKFNVDGSFYKNAAGCGGVLRSYAGDMRALFSGPVENLGPEFAELMAIWTALLVFLEVGWIGKESLIVESDSQVVLNWIANPLLRP